MDYSAIESLSRSRQKSYGMAIPLALATWNEDVTPETGKRNWASCHLLSKEETAIEFECLSLSGLASAASLRSCGLFWVVETYSLSPEHKQGITPHNPHIVLFPFAHFWNLQECFISCPPFPQFHALFIHICLLRPWGFLRQLHWNFPQFPSPKYWSSCIVSVLSFILNHHWHSS